MRREPYIADDGRYMAYYSSQAGSGLPGFAGAPIQYGSGLGGMFRNLFRFALPLLKRGFSIASPHIKTAAKHIAGDVVTNLVARATAPRQDGSGYVFTTRRGLKRPPHGHEGRGSRKRKKTVKCSGKGRSRPQAKRRRPIQTKRNSRDIF